MYKVAKCKNNGVVWDLSDWTSKEEKILEESYYKAQGCTIEEVEDVDLDGCNCDHCKTIKCDFEELIKEIKLTAISENTRY